MKKNYNDNPNIGLSFLYNNRCGRVFLKVFFYNSLLSKLVGLLLDTKLSCILINRFIEKNNIDMEDYEKVKYNSFNDFFIRKIRKERRPISLKQTDLISPCDSFLTCYDINSNLTFNVKNSIYSVESVLVDKKLAEEYKGGKLLVFRLTPSNYHRYHFIDDGELIENYKIDGRFHTVNPIVYEKYEVFKENSRECSRLKLKNFGDVIYVEVGAMLVGKIVNNNIKTFKKGDEKGFFKYGGSTVIVMFKKDMVKLNKKITNNSKKNIETNVKFGEKIGEKC